MSGRCFGETRGGRQLLASSLAWLVLVAIAAVLVRPFCSARTLIGELMYGSAQADEKHRTVAKVVRSLIFLVTAPSGTA